MIRIRSHLGNLFTDTKGSQHDTCVNPFSLAQFVQQYQKDPKKKLCIHLILGNLFGNSKMKNMYVLSFFQLSDSLVRT